MRKLIKSGVVTITLVFCVLTTSFAVGASYDIKTQALSELGLLKGTSAGYESAREPTRAEAAVMIVRLLGMEDKAKAGLSEHPFTDVPKWADGYVGYLYGQDIISGMTDSTFEPDAKCSEQMYITLALRALGYSDKDGDFEFSNVNEFVRQKKLASDYSALEAMSYYSANSFTRDDMFAITYLALFLPSNTQSGESILQSLKSIARVEAAVANKYLNMYKKYERYTEAAKSDANNSIEMKMTGDMNISIKGAQAAESVQMTLDSNIKSIINDGSPVFQYDMIILALGQEADENAKVSSYYSDGWIYMDTAMGKFKVASTYEAALESANYKNSQLPFYMISDINELKLNSTTKYIVVYSPCALGSFLNSFFAMPDMSESSEVKMDIGVEKLSSEAVFKNSDGSLDSQVVVMEIVIAIDDNGDIVTMTADYNLITDVIATGSNVKITPPVDLDEYVEMK